jgi:hypothetical protein
MRRRLLARLIGTNANCLAVATRNAAYEETQPVVRGTDLRIGVKENRAGLAKNT